MEELLIVDGYNIINAWADLKELSGVSMEAARDKLIEKLEDFQGYRGMKVTVVFDAHLVRKNTGSREASGRVDIVYTKENETADHYIERMVDELQGKGRIRVASSDRTEQTIILGRGATRISARELRLEMDLAEREMDALFIKRSSPKQHVLENRLHPSIVEKLEKWRRQK